MTLIEELRVQERDLAKALSSTRNMIRIIGGVEVSPVQTTLAIPPRVRGTRPPRVGTMSMRQAALEVLREAAPEALHCSRILELAKEKGADSNANNPVEAVDLLLYKLQSRKAPIVKTAARTWQWDAEKADPKTWTLETMGRGSA